jgi:hypothetical protein
MLNEASGVAVRRLYLLGAFSTRGFQRRMASRSVSHRAFWAWRFSVMSPFLNKQLCQGISCSKTADEKFFHAHWFFV